MWQRKKRVGRSHKDFPVPLPKDFLYRPQAKARQYGSNIVTRESGECYLLMHSGAKEVGTVAVIKLHMEERLIWLMVLRRFQFIMSEKAQQQSISVQINGSERKPALSWQ